MNPVDRRGLAIGIVTAETVDELATVITQLDLYLAGASDSPSVARIRDRRAELWERYWPMAERLALTGERDGPRDPRSDPL